MIDVDTFIAVITFLIEDCAYFTYNDVVYRQCKGLTMGHSLSKILAEIVTNDDIIIAMQKFNKDQVSFLCKFVDDILSIGDQESLISFQNEINGQSKSLQLIPSFEDSNNSVSYLNLLVKRCLETNTIFTKWSPKEYAAFRILDFHSSHPLETKINVTEEFMKTAFGISDKIFWPEVAEFLKQFLRNSNYPEHFINNRIWNSKKTISMCNHFSIISEIGTTDFDPIFLIENMLVSVKNDEIPTTTTTKTSNKKGFAHISIPYSHRLLNKSRKMLHKLHLNKSIKFAPRIINSNKRKIFSNLKDRKMTDSIVNAIGTVKCNDCSFSCTIVSGDLDMRRKYLHLLRNRQSKLQEHLRSYPMHSFHDNVFNIKQFKSKHQMQLASNIR